MPATPTQPNAVVMGDWKNAGEDYIVVGRVVPLDGGNLAVDFDLLNVLTGQRVGGQRFTGTPTALRNAAHRVSDVVYEKILGIRGAFATRIAYVSVDGQPPAQKFQLIVADADGENQRLVLESRYDNSGRLNQATAWWLQALGRLKPGVSAEQVQGSLDGLFQQALLHHLAGDQDAAEVLRANVVRVLDGLEVRDSR